MLKNLNLIKPCFVNASKNFFNYRYVRYYLKKFINPKEIKITVNRERS